MPIRFFLNLAGAVMLGGLLSGCANTATTVAPRVDLLGAPVPDAAVMLEASRIIAITPDTRWVNVTSGDTVLFVAGNRSFAWNFQVSPIVSVFDLKQIAPPGALPRPVLVYVDPNPLYHTDG
jgi:hypothetical protein